MIFTFQVQRQREIWSQMELVRFLHESLARVSHHLDIKTTSLYQFNEFMLQEQLILQSMQNSFARETQDIFRSRDTNSRFRPYKRNKPPHTEKHTESTRTEQQSSVFDSDDKVDKESVPKTEVSKTPSPSGSPHRATTSSSTR